MVDHTFVYTGAVRKIRELVDRGSLGDIYYYDSTRVNLGLFFQVTAIFLLVFVAQLLIYGFHELTEANLFPNSEALHWATEPYGPDG